MKCILLYYMYFRYIIGTSERNRQKMNIPAKESIRRKAGRLLILASFAALAAALLLTPFAALSVEAGDINLDGSVTSADAVALLRHILLPDGYPTDYPGSTDLNGDGDENSADAVYLLRHVLLPELYPLPEITDPAAPEEEQKTVSDAVEKFLNSPSLFPLTIPLGFEARANEVEDFILSQIGLSAQDGYSVHLDDDLAARLETYFTLNTDWQILNIDTVFSLNGPLGASASGSFTSAYSRRFSDIISGIIFDELKGNPVWAGKQSTDAELELTLCGDFPSPQQLCDIFIERLGLSEQLEGNVYLFFQITANEYYDGLKEMYEDAEFGETVEEWLDMTVFGESAWVVGGTNTQYHAEILLHVTVEKTEFCGETPDGAFCVLGKLQKGWRYLDGEFVKFDADGLPVSEAVPGGLYERFTAEAPDPLLIDDGELRFALINEYGEIDPDAFDAVGELADVFEDVTGEELPVFNNGKFPTVPDIRAAEKLPIPVVYIGADAFPAAEKHFGVRGTDYDWFIFNEGEKYYITGGSQYAAAEAVRAFAEYVSENADGSTLMLGDIEKHGCILDGEAEKNIWRGYLPENGVDPTVFGASYLWYGGSIRAGGLDCVLDTTGALPVLTTTGPIPEWPGQAMRSYLNVFGDNEIGVCPSETMTDVSALPYFKICYLSDTDTLPTTKVTVCQFVKGSPVLRAGESDPGFAGSRTAIGCISSAVSGIDCSDFAVNQLTLLFSPETGSKFSIAYIAFFATEEEAESFSCADGDDSESGIAYYLKNYTLTADAEENELDSEQDAAFAAALAKRIDEILNADSELTPDDVPGTCYYVSSIRGDDANDGLSPETPFKSTQALWIYASNGTDFRSRVKEGDGVFFERGSVFYGGDIEKLRGSALIPVSGAYYGAYGEGPKPVFTKTLDFSDEGGTGVWLETEYPNVYLLDRPVYTQAGNVFFNNGERLGMRIIPKDASSPFGEGKKAITNAGTYSTGYGTLRRNFYNMTNPGTALTNDLEYINDYTNGLFYLYSEGGNPADRFDSIGITRPGACIGGYPHDVWLDNLAAIGSTDYGMLIRAFNVLITNCEIGFSGGSEDSVESGIESYGPADGAVIRDCYFHDIGDGPFTCQSGSHNGAHQLTMSDVTFTGNVVAATGCGVEFWLHPENLRESGVSENRISNFEVSDNIFAYTGCGVPRLVNSGNTGEIISSSTYLEAYRCSFHDNLIYRPAASLLYGFPKTYKQGRGWDLYGNTCVMSPDSSTFTFTDPVISALNLSDFSGLKRFRVYTEFDPQTAAWYSLNGFNRGGVYYSYNEVQSDPDLQPAFATGYYAAAGYLPDFYPGN